MKRREFISLIGGAAAWPLAARAQQPGKPTIGFMGSTTPTVAAQWVGSFVQRLRELGWLEGRDVGIEYRWAEGRPERYAEIAVEFARLKVDVILTHNTPTVLAAKQATSVIPIVFATAGDPIGSGLVANLARPGGNVTGISSQASDTVGKRLELLRELVPGLHRFAVLANLASSYPALELDEVQAASRTLGFEALKGHAEAIYVVADPLTSTNRIRINTLALGVRLPTMHTVREFVEAGGLMSYGSNWPSQFRRAADFVDKILRGAKPADLPIEQA